MPVSDDEEIRVELERIFGGSNVKFNWDIATKSRDLMNHEAYSPEPDFAVGPFNLEPDELSKDRDIAAIDTVYRHTLNDLVEPIRRASDVPNRELAINPNPRFFMGIEVESEHPTMKHKLGGLLNASILSRVGLMVGRDQETTDKIRRIRRYLDTSLNLDKTQWRIDNVLILERDSLLRILQAAENHNVEDLLAGR